MAKAEIAVGTRMVEVEEKLYTVSLTREEAIILVGRLSKGNTCAHGLSWRDDVYHELSRVLNMTRAEEDLRDAHAEIDVTFRKDGYKAAERIAATYGIVV